MRTCRQTDRQAWVHTRHTHAHLETYRDSSEPLINKCFNYICTEDKLTGGQTHILDTPFPIQGWLGAPDSTTALTKAGQEKAELELASGEYSIDADTDSVIPHVQTFRIAKEVIAHHPHLHIHVKILAIHVGNTCALEL
jgi:hypothetical protein